MKMLIKSVAVTAMVLLPAVAFAQKVNVDFDPAADFSKFKTYAWVDGTPSPNPLGEQRIHDEVDKRMAAAGFTKAAANPRRRDRHPPRHQRGEGSHHHRLRLRRRVLPLWRRNGHHDLAGELVYDRNAGARHL